MARKIICPECGQELTPSQVRAHLTSHWGQVCPDSGKFPEAAARYRELEAAMKGGD
jgi:hypothetical protein